MNDSDRGYVAGLIEGEGTIGITATKGLAVNRGKRSHYFSARVKISNTDLRLLEKVQRATGIGTIKGPHRTAGQKPVYEWWCPTSHVERLLTEVLNDLEGKRKQAELVLEFLRYQDAGRARGDKGLSVQDVPAVLAIYKEIRELNRRGTNEAEEIEFEMSEGGPERKRTCDADECSRVRYGGQRWCYKHWLEKKPRLHKTCERCGQEFEAIKSDKRFCSDRCQWETWQEKNRRPDVPVRPHQVTSAEQEAAVEGLLRAQEMGINEIAFEVGVNRSVVRRIATEKGLEMPEGLGHDRWRKRWLEEQAKVEHACPICGQRFHKVNGKQRFCSPSCQLKDEVQRRTERRRAAKEPVQCVCEWCEKQFTHERKTRFCSPNCRVRDWKSRHQ